MRDRISKVRPLVKLVSPYMLSGIAMAAFAWPISSTAGDVEDCNSILELVETEPLRAVSACRGLADQGIAAAQNNLGVVYHHGRGVPQDYGAAFNWYRMAADQGDAVGQYNLALMYADGLGVTEDDEQAVVWYRRAAEQGVAEAQYNLANLLYDNWWSTLVGNAEAVKWYHKAAEQGLAEGQYALGTMYLSGKGVRSDRVQAYMWFDLAARAFPAGEWQDDAINQRGIIASEMTSKQLAEAMRLAREWKPKSAQP